MTKIILLTSTLVLAVVMSAFGTGALGCTDMIATMLITCPIIVWGCAKSGIIEL